MKIDVKWPAMLVCACTVAAIPFYRSETANSPSPAPSASVGSDPFIAELVVGEEVAIMASAPNVPPPINRKHATKVLLNIEVKEHTKMLSDGVSYTYWTFGDDAPGNFIRIREGDLVETTFS